MIALLSDQYPGGDIGTAVSAHTGSGTLPFTGFEAGMFLLLAAVIIAAGWALRRSSSV